MKQFADLFFGIDFVHYANGQKWSWELDRHSTFVFFKENLIPGSIQEFKKYISKYLYDRIR